MKKTTIYSLLLLSLTASYAEQKNEFDKDWCRDHPHILERIKHRDYSFIISEAGDYTCATLDIKRRGKTLFHAEEIGTHYYFGAKHQKNIKPLSHLTADKDLYFLASEWTGGAHCCFIAHIFRIGKDFKEIAHIDSGDFGFDFSDIDHDGAPEIILDDNCLKEQFSSFAYSAFGRVILKYDKALDTYRVSSDLMRKSAPKLNSFSKKIPLWRAEIKKHDNPDWPPPDFVQKVTDLFYTGNKEAALELVNRTWPKSTMGKDKFLSEYRQALQESKFYGDFERQLQP